MYMYMGGNVPDVGVVVDPADQGPLDVGRVLRDVLEKRMLGYL
jgi:hypothetical protein